MSSQNFSLTFELSKSILSKVVIIVEAFPAALGLKWVFESSVYKAKQKKLLAELTHVLSFSADLAGWLNLLVH